MVKGTKRCNLCCQSLPASKIVDQICTRCLNRKRRRLERSKKAEKAKFDRLAAATAKKTEFHENTKDQGSGWRFLVIILIAGSLKGGCNDTGNSTPVPTAGVESNEDKLRRVYDSQGIDYNEKMIRDDTRAIEQLSREFPE